MDNIVVVDGAPVIDASKKERLVTKICKDFGKKGVHVKADNIFMPWDDKAGKSKGCVSLPHSPRPILIDCRYIFIEFRNAEEAAMAIAILNNHAFDSKHTFKLNLFTDIERFANLDETYVEPKTEEYQPRVRAQDLCSKPLLIVLLGTSARLAR